MDDKKLGNSCMVKYLLIILLFVVIFAVYHYVQETQIKLYYNKMIEIEKEQYSEEVNDYNDIRQENAKLRAKVDYIEKKIDRATGSD